MTLPLPTVAQLAAAFWYDGSTGDLIRRVDGGRWGREKEGTIVGSPHNKGYLSITAFGAKLLVHRICFAIAHGQWPEGQVDHIDGNRRNNRLSNLRDVLPHENSQNRHAVRSDSSTNVLGIKRNRNRWSASIRVKGKRTHLGTFDTEKEAHAAYIAAKRKMHPYFNHQEITVSNIPQIVMHQVASSQFAAIGHAPELGLLAIQFHPKKSTGVSDIYHYENFSADLFAEFLGADSHGSFFIQRIKKCADQFPYSKVDQAAFSYTAAPLTTKPTSLAEAPPVKLSKELLAGLLTGREYLSEMFKEEEQQAKAAGLIVIFGASDDLMEFRGFIDDERGAPTIALIDAKGLLPFREDIEHDDEALKDYFARAPQVRAVDALWAKEDGYSWTYRTTIPHATFEIVEGGEPYCRGIVIDVADLGGAA